MTDLRADSMTGEQFVFDERTADPASTEEGERWLRTDLTSGDKIATLRVDVGTSVLDVPVFPVGTAEDSVVEAIRVRVGSQTGYIPAVPETNANFPALRLQHNGQVFGYHDEQGVFAFFDVSISATNSPVDEGSDLNVDYSVVNTGFSVNNTQDIRLNIDSTEEDRDPNITLSPSSSTTGTLTWTTPSSSAGTYNASVLSDDDTASTSVTVEEVAIPDSAVHQWTLAPDVTTEDDQIGTVSLTHSGPTRVTSSDYFDGAARDYDGIDDTSDADSQLNFTGGELTNSDFAIGLTVDLAQLDTSTTKDVNLLHHQPTATSDPEVSISVANDSADVIDFGARDASNDLQLSADVSGFSGLLRVLVSFDASAWDGTIWYNASDQAPASGNANFAGGIGDLRLGATLNDSGYEDTILDNVIIYNQSADQSLADADLALQPWL